MMSLSKESSKELKAQLAQVTSLVNKARMRLAFSRAKSKSYSELLDILAIARDSPFIPNGYKSIDLDKQITISEFNLFAKELLENYNKSIIVPLTTQECYPVEIVKPEDQRLIVSDTDDNIFRKEVILPEERDTKKFIESHLAWSILDKVKNNPLQKITLFDFQLKQALKIFWKLYGTDNPHRGHCYVGPTGSGKTFVNGQLARWTTDLGYPKMYSLGPYPILYLTKATVVEQTTRVLRDQFGLRIPGEVLVTNFDQLRSKSGKRFIDERKIVQDGVVYYDYHWYPGIHPHLIFTDECQAVKNESSKQSVLIQALSKLQDDDLYPLKFIACSATPFARVSEAKAVVVNLRMPYDPWKPIKYREEN